MIVLAYLHGMNDPLAKETEGLKGACDFLDTLGEHRIDKAVIVDFSTTDLDKQTKEAMAKVDKNRHF